MDIYDTIRRVGEEKVQLDFFVENAVKKKKRTRVPTSGGANPRPPPAGDEYPLEADPETEDSPEKTRTRCHKKTVEENIECAEKEKLWMRHVRGKNRGEGDATERLGAGRSGFYAIEKRDEYRDILNMVPK